MDDYTKKINDKLQSLIKAGHIKEGAIIEYDEGDPYIDEKYINYHLGTINDCGCMPHVVWWL